MCIYIFYISTHNDIRIYILNTHALYYLYTIHYTYGWQSKSLEYCRFGKMYTIHCTLYSVNCTLYSVNCTLNTTKYTTHNDPLLFWSSITVKYIVTCTLHSIHRVIRSNDSYTAYSACGLYVKYSQYWTYDTCYSVWRTVYTEHLYSV